MKQTEYRSQYVMQLHKFTDAYHNILQHIT